MLVTTSLEQNLPVQATEFDENASCGKSNMGGRCRMPRAFKLRRAAGGGDCCGEDGVTCVMLLPMSPSCNAHRGWLNGNQGVMAHG